MLDEIAPSVAEQHARLSAEHAGGGQRWMDLPSIPRWRLRSTRLPPRPDRVPGLHPDRHRRLVTRRDRHDPGAGPSVSQLAAVREARADRGFSCSTTPIRKRSPRRWRRLICRARSSMSSPSRGKPPRRWRIFSPSRQALEAAVGRERARQQIVATTDPNRGAPARARGPGGVPYLSRAARGRWPDDRPQRGRHAAGRHVWLRYRCVCWPARAPCGPAATGRRAA